VQRKKSLLTIWTSHLKTKEEKDKLQELIKITLENKAIERLIDIIDSKLTALETTTDFSNPNWANEQAYILGQKESLRQIRNILTNGK
jgi:hypothetical protein